MHGDDMGAGWVIVEGQETLRIGRVDHPRQLRAVVLQQDSPALGVRHRGHPARQIVGELLACPQGFGISSPCLR